MCSLFLATPGPVTFFATAGEVNRATRVPWRPPGQSGLEHVVREERQRRLGSLDRVQIWP